MALFPLSFGNKYIMVVVNFVSKWVEAIIIPTNNARVVKEMFKSIIFSKIWCPANCD